jgi:hypothetical protein
MTARLDITSFDLPHGPPRGSPLGELRALREPARLAMSWKQLRRAPRGDGRPVLAVPGFGTGDRATAPLRFYLEGLGYDPQGWSLGRNRGNPEEDAKVLAVRVARIAAERGPVTLVGCSLGGVIAREVARARPEHVRSVVTYGSPVLGGSTHTIVYRMFDADEVMQFAARLAQLDRERPVSVPVTSIYTRRDRIVNWLACLDRWTPTVEHVEVRSSHLGLCLDPDVWLAVAEAIART